MAFLEHKLNLKVQQKQVLTPSLVQMVNLLALNKLELTDMIQQELVQNPVLEEGTEIVEGPELSVESPDLALSRNGAEPVRPSVDAADDGETFLPGDQRPREDCRRERRCEGSGTGAGRRSVRRYRFSELR